MLVRHDSSERLSAETDTGLQLPFDRLKRPGQARQLARHLFAFLALEGCGAAAAEPLLTAAYAAQLARYTTQSTVPLEAAVFDEPLKLRWRSQLTLSTEPGRSCRALQDEAARGLVARAPAIEAQPAAICFVPAGFSATPGSLTQADLSLLVWPDGSRWQGAFDYDEQLFEPATVRRFAEHLQMLATGFVTTPDDSFQDLKLLGCTEEEALRAAGEGSRVAYAQTPVHRLIEARASQAPEAVAVRFRDRTLAYGELNDRANRLAHQMLARGIGAETRVMVCLEPGFDIAVALLAVLKAGGVYVPLEPTYPQARLQVILEDTAPALILSSQALIDKLVLGAFPVLALDREAAALAGHSAVNPTPALSLTQTAYIYYTSGTTGKPKGVMASHANLIQYIVSAQERYAFNSHDVMPAIARFSFSISLLELLSPLVAGGTVVVLEREHVLDLARMTQTFQEITFFHAGPSLLRGLTAYIRHHHRDFSVFGKVRHASAGGDMVPPELLENLKEIFPRAEVFVIYGCSEVACMGCTYPAPRDRTVTRSYVGGPFDNMTVRIFDSQHRLMPFGMPGEICFSGGGVVKGYLNRPELTAEKFFEVDGQRFYGTGDMGRVNAAGEVEILGRRDFQIQLRGMRIELGEIEYTLRKAPGVRDGVVMARTDGGGEKTLVAYVVYQPGETANPAAVRQHMLQNLPDYMVPTFYVELAALPLNHNMKVDRYALPVPSVADQRSASTVRLRPAQTATEKSLAALWQKLLRTGEVGLDDNFFEIGGHSMLAVELILDVERDFGVTLDGMDVLRESLEVLAGLVDERLGRPRKPPSERAPERASHDVVESFYFGDEEQLYGVFHGTGANAAQALLICAPVGQENLRCHFVLQKMARQLAERGIAVLRFDYFGCGNSAGRDFEATPSRWRQDVATAFNELRRRAPRARISILGARLGALLAWNVRDRFEVAQLIVWDPIASGTDHLAHLRARHEARVRGLHNLRLGKKPRAIAGAEELVGFTYSRAALAELEQLAIEAAPAGARSAIDWIATAPEQLQRELFEKYSAGRYIFVEHACEWADIRSAGDILPDVGFSRAVLELMQKVAS